MGRTVRRVAMLLIVAGIGGFAVLHPEVVRAYYQDIYPSDPAKRQALDLCFMQDHKFNRLDSGEREACYRHILYAVGETSAAVAVPDANPIDLRRDAALGHLQRNDVRRQEQNDNAPHATR